MVKDPTIIDWLTTDKREEVMRAIAGFMMLLLVGCAHMDHPMNAAGERQPVADAAAGWVAAYNSRDLARIVAYYEKDAVFWGTTSATLRTTPEQIAEYFKNVSQRPDARVSIVDQEIRVTGDMAFSAGTYTFTDIRDGKSVANPSRFTFVFRKRDGQWRLVHHHSSRIPAP